VLILILRRTARSENPDTDGPAWLLRIRDLYRKAAGLDYEFLAAREVDKAKADASGVIADV
jgi:hypothetical protein